METNIFSHWKFMYLYKMRSGTIKKIPVRGVFFSALICGCYWGLHTGFCNTHIIFHPHVGHTSVYMYIYICAMEKPCIFKHKIIESNYQSMFIMYVYIYVCISKYINKQINKYIYIYVYTI